MRIAITGATGNLGTALLRRLAADTTTSGAHDVVGIVRRPPERVPPYDAVTWHAVDLADADATERLAPAFADADAVVHLAWLFQPSRDIGYLERTAVRGSRAVIDAAERTGVSHLVHLSSLGAYSPAPDKRRVDESWPTDGIDTLAYSRHKAAVERLLDEREAVGTPLTITRIRPGLVVQRDAGSALMRYAFPAYVPGAVLRFLPVLPLDRRFRVPVVHSDDVADALVRVLSQRAGGAFNLAAEPPVTRDDVADALGAYGVHLPAPLLSTALGLTWRARVQPLDPGWLDLAFAVPLLDTTRARTVLGWEPVVDARDALREVIGGMAASAAAASPVLRPRSVVRQLQRVVRWGPVGDRRFP